MPTATTVKTIHVPSSRPNRFALNAWPGRWGVSAVIILSYLVLAFQPDLRLAVSLMAGISALVTVLLCICLYAGETHRWRCSPVHVMGVAILIRLLFVWRPAELSDDIFRYLWDGLRLLAGHNPYAVAPAAASLDGYASAGLLTLVNHSHLTTIYPPAAQLVFAAGACLKSGIYGIKAILVLFDLIVCLLIMRLLPVLGRPAGLAVVYAWHPLPVLEIAASGHIDGAGLLFLMLALCLLIRPAGTRPPVRRGHQRWRAFAAGLAFAAAVLTKLFPLVFLPGLLLLAGRSRWKQVCLGAACVLVMLTLPFAPDIRHAWGTLALYARTWEFSGFLYRLLASTSLTGMHARLLLGLAFVGVTVAACRAIDRRYASVTDLLRIFYIQALAFLLLTPTLHPWYALYLVLFLPFTAGPGGLVLAWAVLLAYRVLIPYTLAGAWVEDDLTPLMIAAAPVAAWAAASVRRGRQAINRPRLSARIDPPGAGG